MITIFGLRGYRRKAVPLIILNRLLHKFNFHLCAFCYKFVRFSDCYGCINDDCLCCEKCFHKNVTSDLEFE